MEKPSPWEQNRCAFSSRDTSKLVGRQEHHVTTDKGLSRSSAHRAAPVRPNPPSNHPLLPAESVLWNAYRRFSIRPHLSSFPLYSAPGTHTRTQTHTHKEELDHQQNPTVPAWRGKGSAGMRRISLPKPFKMSAREEL